MTKTQHRHKMMMQLQPVEQAFLMFKKSSKDEKEVNILLEQLTCYVIEKDLSEEELVKPLQE